MKTKTCICCGKEFLYRSDHPNKKYCSHKCYCLHKTLKEIGKKYGRLTILGKDLTQNHKKTHVICKCDCGNITSVRLDSLKKGEIKSCGCYHQELCKRGTKPIEHGMTGKRLYNVWQGMKQRCYYSKHTHYKYYGGRGITVCKEWKNDFNNFYEWAIQNGYDKNAKRSECTIDRIDVNGNYEPNNCRWVSQSIQNMNKRARVVV